MKGSEAISERFRAIFKTIRFAFDGERLYKTNEEFNWESRTVYLGFNYRFGSGKNKAAARKQRDKNETQGGGGLL